MSRRRLEKRVPRLYSRTREEQIARGAAGPEEYRHRVSGENVARSDEEIGVLTADDSDMTRGRCNNSSERVRAEDEFSEEDKSLYMCGDGQRQEKIGLKGCKVQ